MVESIGNFEQDLEQLENLVSKMESGKLSLEESLKAFETGVTLAKQCQTVLTAAEQKIRILTDTHLKEGGNIQDVTEVFDLDKKE